jgi:nitrite reductase/ring-hydroxylating ferredoxin subunit/uncharacterized membrane protein
MDLRRSDRLAALPGLDAVANGLKQVFEPIVGEGAPRRWKDALVGTWLGHPLHPAVVTMPLGFWTSAFVLDLAGQEDAADLTVGLGLASAFGAAITGAAQWQDATNDDKPRRLGALHASLNIMATMLYGTSYFQRKYGSRDLGFALSIAGLATVTASAWVGGHLSYELGIGVDHTAFQQEPTDWVEVLEEQALEEGVPKRVRAKNYPVLLIKRSGRVLAIGAVCPHLGGPLDKGKIEGDTVTCPWHGSVFCLEDGDLIHGPASTPAKAFDVRVEGGKIAVRARTG